MDLNRAMAEYRKKYNDKIKNYTEVHINYGDDEEEEKKSKKSKKAEPKVNVPKKESTLHPSVKNLMNMIFDMKMIETTMKEIGYDPKKMPLGKLADQTIKEGF